MEQPIIVSAIGYNSVNGWGAERYWTQDYRTPGNELIEDVDPQKYLNNKGQKFLNRASLIYCNIAFQCIHQRALQDYIKTAPDRVGLYDSSELSNVEACFMFDLIARNEGPDYVSPMNAPNTIANAAASQMAIQAGIKGPNVSVCSGAAGSLQALDIACLHLKQNITDYAIVGSTEVINKYQTSIRKGERRNTDRFSPELGAALLIERAGAPKSAVPGKQLAAIRQFASGTQVAGESKEALLWRLIQQVMEKSGCPIDLLLVSGGAYNLDEEALESLLLQHRLAVPVAYPEQLYGAGDNAGGILGIMYAIGLFNSRLPSVPTRTGEAPVSPGQVRNLAVASVDMTGGASVVLLSNPTLQHD